MNNALKLLPAWLLVFACESESNISSVNEVNWSKRAAQISPMDTLQKGTTYLSVYSEIYSQTEHRTHGLTATVSMRNVNEADTVFIDHADYFNTHGELIRSYFKRPIYIAPMETVEIVIDEEDLEGGTGANFLFKWQIPSGIHPPLFEGVMISSSGQQGLSFTTQGKQLTL